MIRRCALLAAALAAVSGCARTTVESAGGEVASVTPANARQLPVGTTIEVKTNAKLDADHNKVGDSFATTVTDAVVATNGETIVPQGSTIEGHITGLQNAPKTGEPSVIRVDFDRIIINGSSYPFNAGVTEVKPPNLSNETLQKAGIGAAAGAVLGAIISGADLDKILLGGALGAAAGTVISLGTDKEPELPSGTRMKLRVTQAVAVR